MPTAKIEIKLGSFSFSGEADDAWLEKQLDKIIKELPKLEHVAAEIDSREKHEEAKEDAPKGTLASFLKEKSATQNQVKKFLATAAWLQRRGKTRLSTRDVTQTLNDNHQSKLNNPADCLGKNVKKGLCEKDGKDFYVTEEGFSSL